MKLYQIATALVLILSSAVASAQSGKGIDDLPVGTLIKTVQTSIEKNHTLAALALLAKRGIVSDIAISSSQAETSRVCETLALPWVHPKDNNPYYWNMIGVQFGGKVAIKDVAGKVLGWRYKSVIQCGLFDRYKQPSCGSSRICY